jgi:hypothetical protein
MVQNYRDSGQVRRVELETALDQTKKQLQDELCAQDKLRAENKTAKATIQRQCARLLQLEQHHEHLKLTAAAQGHDYKVRAFWTRMQALTRVEQI